MLPNQLSRELREETTPNLTRRRWVIGLSLVGAAGIAVTLYQTGIIKHLPDPPLPLVDSDKVDASNYAYSRFSSPDAPLMIVNYGLTALLASMGGKNRAQEMPLAVVALGIKTLLDVALNLELACEEWNENKAFCAYCQAASMASLALTVPETIAAVENLFADSRLEKQIATN